MTIDLAVWAIVPVKPFRRAKSRLAGVLTADERAGLSRTFLAHALEVLRQVPAIIETLVISRDSDALALAREHQARTVTESGAPDLNRALARATQVARAARASAVLVLPTDLPLLAADDVRQLIECASAEHRSVVVAPDRHEQGTNALLVRPPGLIRYAFGRRSFQRHIALAEQAGAEVSVCRLAGAALDVDQPEDWLLYQAARKP